jgi:hypothetical protein
MSALQTGKKDVRLADRQENRRENPIPSDLGTTASSPNHPTWPLIFYRAAGLTGMFDSAVVFEEGGFDEEPEAHQRQAGNLPQ